MDRVICPHCHEREVETGHKKCRPCLDDNKNQVKAYYYRCKKVKGSLTGTTTHKRRKLHVTLIMPSSITPEQVRWHLEEVVEALRRSVGTMNVVQKQVSRIHVDIRIGEPNERRATVESDQQVAD